MPKEITIEKNCPECQFENGKHSLECSRYKEPTKPMPKEIKELEEIIYQIIKESCPTFFAPMGLKLTKAKKLKEDIEGNYGYELKTAITENLYAYLEGKPEYAYNRKLIKKLLCPKK